MLHIFAMATLLAVAVSISSIEMSFAQTSNVTISTNRTVITSIGEQNTTLVNITTVPVLQREITISQVVMPAEQSDLKQFESLTIGEPVDISTLQNQTIVSPIANATTIIINQTSLPFNQTTVVVGNLTRDVVNQP